MCRLTDGDKSVELLITQNLPLVTYIAKRFDGCGIELEDLISIGTIGLCEAAQSFDPSRRFEFSTYAGNCIKNEILMWLRKKNLDTLSLDAPFTVGEDDEITLHDIVGTDKDMIVGRLLKSEQSDTLRKAFSQLCDIDKTILIFTFGLNDSPRLKKCQIEKLVGLSHQSCYTHKMDALKKLRKAITNG